MEKIPQGRYTREFREEIARLAMEDGMSAGEVSARLSLPKTTVENRVRAAKAGKLGEIGRNRKPLTEVKWNWPRSSGNWLSPGWSETS